MRSIQQTHHNASYALTNAIGNTQKHVYTSSQVSEIIYDPQNPFTLHLLLPFLQQLGHQPRWQLWLSPERRLNRYWINSLGLPENKTIGLNSVSTESTIEMMEKALRSGNFSSVIAWLPAISPEIKERLNQAAKEGDCYGFILQSLPMLQSALLHNDMFSKSHWH
ncbi:cell division inhibitor SulA [Limnobaculum zhutongyuii]|uniref:Cell division inhibitor SulA n=1 Tax=Limnobaculum zhutongyuii TaxID=2498113 RepID=A0A411WIT6_9GAMM|nr:SOS-induced cell division inhibitor SulA [Limnobaculum zhutongyuii]QBH96102.1 cell division inhibitor SulA [Limnobaculum zhutongyuii]TQS87235.1 cell division inhibitor SulA [Limnobaculum zhutongyuii]